MNIAVILLGSNTGDRLENMKQAFSLVSLHVGSPGRTSHIYETEPWGRSGQPEYYNQVVEVFTPLDAKAVMMKLLETETQMGRKRTEKWAPRLIDLDILYFNEEIIREKELTIPHPHLQERRFTLVPLCEILPEMIHPVIGKKNKELLEASNDKLRVKIIKHDKSFIRKISGGIE